MRLWRLLYTAKLRLRSLLRRDQVEQDLADEFRDHLELRIAEDVAKGMTPDEARAAALRAFGGIEQRKEDCRDARGTRVADQLRQDLTYGLRMIGKSPGFSAVAIVSLAIGIGASTVLFSFGNAFLFRPLHARNASELVQVFTSDFDGPLYGGSSYADYEDFRDGTHVFGALLASARTKATLSDTERSDVLPGLLVSGNYFDVLGLRPSLGRGFLVEETRPSATEPVVMLSHHTWLRRYNADPGIVGRAVRLNGRPFSVIGIGPPGFAGTSFDEAADFFAPVAMHATLSSRTDLRDRQARYFTILGRLAAGVSREQADAGLRQLAADLFVREPVAWRDASGRGRAITALPEIEARHAKSGPGPVVWIFSTVVAGVAVLLAITCVNVATVLLARATTRRKEMAIRLAMGASRRRVVMQLLTESALLAAAGGLMGLALAHWSAALFARFRPGELPAFDLTLDYRILLFNLAASLVAVVCFGIAPALRTTRPDLNAELKDAVSPVRFRRFHVDLRDALVVVQVALSLALVVGAVLMYRSFAASHREDLGFRKSGVLSVETDLSTIPDAGASPAPFYREAVRTIGALPGVGRVALAALVPMDGTNMSANLAIRERASLVSISPDINVVSDGYFALMDIAVLAGREFDPSDRAGTPAVAVVNEAMAREYWNGNAVGQVLENSAGTPIHVVGIVRDLRHRSFAEPPRPMLYFAADQRYRPRMTLHVRTDAPPAAIGAAIQRALRSIQPAAGLTRVRTMEEYLHDVTMPQRLGGSAAAAIGALELVLALMALYGVIAYAASQRTREIGLRMALGATAGSVVVLLMRKGLTLAAVGVLAGAGLALASGSLLESLLIGVAPTDPASFAGGALLLLLIAGAASYLPARRALRVDPSVALRRE